MIGVKLKGRLGNQMFQYSVLRLVAERTGYEFTFNKNWLGAKYFTIDYGSDNKVTYNKVFKEDKNKFNRDVFNISDNTLLDGYWQSTKYFEGYEEFVTNLFNLKNIQTNIELDNDTCLIHFRGGDYFNHGYVPSKTWYNNAKKEMLLHNPNTKFYIITDDINKAKQFLPNDEIISSSLINDFYLLKEAKNKIISSSTFSWWAYWLNKNNSGITIAPNNWLNHNGVKSIVGFYPFDIETSGINYLK